jgi:hypothetical protein
MHDPLNNVGRRCNVTSIVAESGKPESGRGFTIVEDLGETANGQRVYRLRHDSGFVVEESAGWLTSVY